MPMDETQIAILVAFFVIVVVVVLILRRPRNDQTNLLDGIRDLKAAAEEKNAEFLQARSDADRNGALANDRKTEIDRLNGDLSKLRAKLDQDAEEKNELISTISRLETEKKNIRNEADNGKEVIERLNGDLSTLRDKLDLEAKNQNEQSNAISRLETEKDVERQKSAERKEEIDRLNEQLSKLRTRLEQEAEKKNEQSNTISKLNTQLDVERNTAKEKLDTAIKIREEMVSKFREIAQEALKVQGESFSKSNLEKLDAVLSPLKENVGHFEKELKTVYDEAVKERERLKTEIGHLSKRSEEISKEALALTRALKSDPQKQGAWGEMILEKILEVSGLRKGTEYETQAHREGQEGERLRPDVIVNLPGGKTLVIDSKVSLVAYTDAVNAETEEQAAAARKRHASSLRGHINVLASKEYQAAEDASVDYVIMFVPIEGALSEALREEGAITEYALERRIMIATPTTLMMALKTVANVWAVERRNRNAEEIADRAGRLYDKVAGFVESMSDLGNRLVQAKNAHDKAFDQLSRGKGNLLSQADRLRSLGAKNDQVYRA